MSLLKSSEIEATQRVTCIRTEVLVDVLNDFNLSTDNYELLIPVDQRLHIFRSKAR